MHITVSLHRLSHDIQSHPLAAAVLEATSTAALSAVWGAAAAGLSTRCLRLASVVDHRRTDLL